MGLGKRGQRVRKTRQNVLLQCRKGLGRGTGGNLTFTCTISLDGGGGMGVGGRDGGEG